MQCQSSIHGLRIVMPLMPGLSFFPDSQSCPVCQQSYAEILTEQEYAEASDHYAMGDVDELGLRRLPCRTPEHGTSQANEQKADGHADSSESEARRVDGHEFCGKCATTWLRSVSVPNHIPMSRECSHVDNLNDVATEQFVSHLSSVDGPFGA